MMPPISTTQTQALATISDATRKRKNYWKLQELMNSIILYYYFLVQYNNLKYKVG